MDNPLKIDEEDIIVYGDLPLNVIDKEKAWFRNHPIISTLFFSSGYNIKGTTIPAKSI